MRAVWPVRSKKRKVGAREETWAASVISMPPRRPISEAPHDGTVIRPSTFGAWAIHHDRATCDSCLLFHFRMRDLNPSRRPHCSGCSIMPSRPKDDVSRLLYPKFHLVNQTAVTARKPK